MTYLFKKISMVIGLTLFCSSLALAQSDSTNLPGLSAGIQTPMNTSLGSGVPDPNQLDAVTTTTETEVLPCPSGYYPNGAVPTDGTDVANQTVGGGVIYDQTVTTNRYGTTTYGGWTEVNFLCTQIPPAPTCPTGETEIAAPYWDSATNTWVGIQCALPAPSATTLMASCSTALQNWVRSQPWSIVVASTIAADSTGNISYSGFSSGPPLGNTNAATILAQSGLFTIYSNPAYAPDDIVYYGLGISLLDDGGNALYIPYCKINSQTGAIDTLNANYILYSCSQNGGNSCGYGG